MRHFGHLAPDVRERAVPPGAAPSSPPTPRAGTLAVGPRRHPLQPGHPPTLADDIAQAGRARRGLHGALPGGLHRRPRRGRGRGQPRRPARRPVPAARRAGLPLLFVRVRAPEQITDLVRRLGPAVAAAVRIRAAEVHRGERRALPGGARRRRGSDCGRRLLRHAGAGVARAAAPGEPGRDAGRHRPHRRQVPRPGAGGTARRHRLLLRLRAAPRPRHDRLRRRRSSPPSSPTWSTCSAAPTAPASR